MKVRSILSVSVIAVSFLIANASSAAEIDADSYYSLAGVDPLVFVQSKEAEEANTPSTGLVFEESLNWESIQ